eukprot:3579427-Prymnesium_polylepis.1
MARLSSPECAPGVDSSRRKVTGDTPVRVRRSGGYLIWRVICGSNWTEFGPNFGAGDRGRSNKDRRRSKEVGRISPNFADLRSISPASRVILDPIRFGRS